MAHRILFSCLAICLLASCSQFNSTWRDACARPLSAQGIEGPWEGEWTSESTGHTGRLRCIVGPPMNAEGDHLFTYRASWKKIFSGTFRPVHRVVSKGADVHSFKGSHQMPDWAGGLYVYEGAVVDGSLVASYRCAKDQGVFRMRRP